jgi:hypothetical protein
MTKDEKLVALQMWESTINESDSVFDPMIEMMGLHPDGALCEIFGRLQSDLTESVSMAVGDTNGWLAWYWLENDMGNKGMEAGYNGNLKKIRFVDELLELIEQGQSTDTKL